MGQQESFLFFNPENSEENNRKLAELVVLFQKHGIRCKDDWVASVTHHATFLKSWHYFPKGMDILILYGGRQAQLNGARLADVYEEEEEDFPCVMSRAWDVYTKEEQDLLKSVYIEWVDLFEYHRPRMDYEELFHPSNGFIKERKVALKKDNQAS